MREACREGALSEAASCSHKVRSKDTDFPARAPHGPNATRGLSKGDHCCGSDRWAPQDTDRAERRNAVYANRKDPPHLVL